MESHAEETAKAAVHAMVIATPKNDRVWRKEG